MKFKIFEEVEEAEETIYFKLRRHGGEIQLTACNVDGERLPCGNILSITATGKIALCSAVSSKCGLQLDSKQCVMVEGGQG